MAPPGYNQPTTVRARHGGAGVSDRATREGPASVTGSSGWGWAGPAAGPLPAPRVFRGRAHPMGCRRGRVALATRPRGLLGLAAGGGAGVGVGWCEALALAHWGL